MLPAVRAVTVIWSMINDLSVSMKLATLPLKYVLLPSELTNTLFSSLLCFLNVCPIHSVLKFSYFLLSHVYVVQVSVNLKQIVVRKLPTPRYFGTLSAPIAPMKLSTLPVMVFPLSLPTLTLANIPAMSASIK